MIGNRMNGYPYHFTIQNKWWDRSKIPFFSDMIGIGNGFWWEWWRGLPLRGPILTPSGGQGCDDLLPLILSLKSWLRIYCCWWGQIVWLTCQTTLYLSAATPKFTSFNARRLKHVILPVGAIHKWCLENGQKCWQGEGGKKTKKLADVMCENPLSHLCSWRMCSGPT